MKAKGLTQKVPPKEFVTDEIIKQIQNKDIDSVLADADLYTDLKAVGATHRELQDDSSFFCFGFKFIPCFHCCKEEDRFPGWDADLWIWDAGKFQWPHKTKRMSSKHQERHVKLDCRWISVVKISTLFRKNLHSLMGSIPVLVDLWVWVSGYITLQHVRLFI